MTACQRPSRLMKTSVHKYLSMTSLPFSLPFSVSLPVTMALSPKTRTFISPMPAALGGWRSGLQIGDGFGFSYAAALKVNGDPIVGHDFIQGCEVFF